MIVGKWYVYAIADHEGRDIPFIVPKDSCQHENLPRREQLNWQGAKAKAPRAKIMTFVGNRYWEMGFEDDNTVEYWTKSDLIAGFGKKAVEATLKDERYRDFLVQE